MKLIKRWMKRAEIEKNRIIIPLTIIKKYGREFYMEEYEDGTIKLIPIKK